MRITLSALNEAALNDPAGLIESAERTYRQEIEKIAHHIADDDDIKIVALAGPSGSGKTTTAHILQEILETLSEKTAVVSLDDFYLPQDRLPILPDGSTDYESVHSLDTELIRERMLAYLETGTLELPKYDFTTHTRKPESKTVCLGNRGIVITEGLHALNPLITDLVPRKNIYKIYISINEKVYDGNGTVLLDGRRLRLARRVLRDEVFRGTDVNRTLSLWENVIRGEEKYLYCFKDTADVHLKTFHGFEPGVYRDRFLRSATKLSDTAPAREYFCQTVTAMERFVPIDPAPIPESSLIREFIGDGKYQL